MTGFRLIYLAILTFIPFTAPIQAMQRSNYPKNKALNNTLNELAFLAQTIAMKEELAIQERFMNRPRSYGGYFILEQLGQCQDAFDVYQRLKSYPIRPHDTESYPVIVPKNSLTKARLTGFSALQQCY